jgi:hypothetical protein
MPHNAFGFPGINENDVITNRMYTGDPLQAAGNLTYIEFLALVKALWENAYPQIPFEPEGGGQYASYPVITYGLELRRTHTVEPKPRTRYLPKDVDQIIYGQRFQNIISFNVITRANKADVPDDENPGYSGAEAADRIIEVFEDFMLEHTPVFKRLGASEFVYSRRMADSKSTRNGIDVCKRTVTYMLTTEKLISTTISKIEKIIIDVRRYMATEAANVQQATPSYENTEVNLIDLYQSASPSY